ncbi:MAG: glutamine-hydrolyzing carbamoyl-phosphate synthase small subunit [Saprospiraceae bacterium]|nr:glutamine-hydrolyzing carbamoyl-phosphate synthase small subunit [Candidatus Vicinibacter affinis]MBP6172154.1 glutamine-hydrolyzing carbamoyl-phosphate synthase small subunit [Saprospiraceae bacterium]MBK7304950.1 glutamine-hydrolyzing carbamoyl-phosphate synthase small subunit [Candidatus Vicinibacter affinis]MBK7799638.1 glutamine-hydrolyzing carbamoyl-phosphate synthase small subunit [Candidatus Vicinibacter affinis]MBK8641479.1 glutamine-hydrolyzing carbamoyl-phosphate synthase small su
MSKNFREPAILLLKDGTVFHGKSAGIIGTTVGEICFNTGMTGYQEIFTDPSYFRQILVMTNVHIGNYGTHQKEVESSNIQIAGLVCRNFSDHFSRLNTDSSLQEYLEMNSLVCIHDIDTRALVRHIRVNGAMNAIISNEQFDIQKLRELLDGVPDMHGLELASKVTTKQIYDIPNTENSVRLAVLDFGIKSSILKQLNQHHFNVRVFPAQTNISTMLDWKPDAFFLSNGPGDPSSMDYAIQTASQILESGKPAFGICLGHQIFGLAMGIKTVKMLNGHRGSNHAVLNLETGLGEITCQNHGFALDTEQVLSSKHKISLSHINLNDKSVEGIRINDRPVFSVQYHPEAGPGPHDSRYLFHQFSSMVNKELGISQILN